MTAFTARLRVSVARRCRELSAGTRCAALFVDSGDHAVEVGEDLLVHLNDAGTSGGLGGVDESQRPAAVFAQFGQKLGAGQEHRAGQRGIRCPMLRADPKCSIASRTRIRPRRAKGARRGYQQRATSPAGTACGGEQSSSQLLGSAGDSVRELAGAHAAERIRLSG